MPLKITRRGGQGNWILRGTVAGCRVYRSTGTDQRRLAEAQRIRLETELLERASLGRAATLTFAEAALAYLESGGEARHLGRILTYFGPDTLARDIDAETVNRAARALYPAASGATINRQLITPISAVINAAANDGLIPPRRFRKRPAPGARLRWLTPEEAEALIAAAEDLAPHMLRPLGILLGGGARAGEALALERADLHLETGEAYLARTKNGEARMIRLPARAVAMLTAQPLPETGPICRTPKGQPYVIRSGSGGQMQAGFAKIRAAAGLGAEVTPHVLRHTWATWYYAATRDFGGLMDLGGWRSANMVNRYRKIAPEDLGDRLHAAGWDFGRAAFRRGAGSSGPVPGLRIVGRRG